MLAVKVAEHGLQIDIVIKYKASISSCDLHAQWLLSIERAIFWAVVERPLEI